MTQYQSVDIEFNADPYRYAKGTGVEYDYQGRDRYGRVAYTMCPFYFHVDNGWIYLDYTDGSHVVIRNYSLSGRYFYGVFCDYYTGEYLADFKFERINDWRYRGNGYYTRSGKQDATEYYEVPSPLLQGK